MTSSPSVRITEKKVVLYSFPPVPHAYSISPFGIKVESYLRIHKIPYEIVYTSAFGPKHKIPYIDLVTFTPSRVDDPNSHTEHIETIPDSNVIISRLNQEFNNYRKPNGDTIVIHDKTLTKQEKAIGHVITRMIEEHTSIIGFYYRYVLHVQTFMEVLNIHNNIFNADTSHKGAIVAKMFQRMMPKGFLKKMKGRGLSGHSDEELWNFSEEDLSAVESLFSDGGTTGSNYFFGDNRPSSLDCMLFGHLSQLLYIPMDFPQKDYLKNNCPKLLAFMANFRVEHWSDWTEKCQRQANKKLLENNDKKKGALGKVLPLTITMVFIALLAKKLYFNN